MGGKAQAERGDKLYEEGASRNEQGINHNDDIHFAGASRMLRAITPTRRQMMTAAHYQKLAFYCN